MASRSHRWFDEAKLLPGERMVRSAAVRLRTAGPPYWWEGDLILTSDRLFFLPHTEHPRLHHTAFWLCDLTRSEPSGRQRFTVRTADDAATFHLAGPRGGPAGLIGDRAAGWLAAIAAVRAAARPRATFERPTRRAAG